MLAALGLAAWMRDFTVDDALISVRYARHLAEGVGYRFNASGPSTDGVTPLPWPFVLALFAHAPPLAVLARAKAFGFVVWLAAAAGWGRAVGRAPASPVAKGAAIGLLALCLPVAAHAVSGMETAVAMALATFASIAEGTWSACVLAGLVASLRPEMVVWATVFAAGVGPLARAVPRVLVAAAPFALCALVRTLAFGHAAPLAVSAKPSDLTHGLVYAAAAALVSLAPIAACAPLALARTPDRATALAVAGAAHFATLIAVGGDWMPYARLAAPIAPSLLYAFVVASKRMSRPLAALRVAVAGALGVYVLVRAAPAGRHVGAHAAALIEAARPALAGAHRIASIDVGWPTAASDADLVDLGGLTDPEFAALPGGNTSKHVDPAVLLARGPDVILLYWRNVAGERRFRDSLEARLAASELISRHYEARAPLPSYGEDDAGYVVLVKR
ncbi:MAG TPA: hypothetical protein VGI39_28065 [Polyangiaceae bacterium]